MDALAGVSCTRVYQLILNGRPQSGATVAYSLTGPTGTAITLQSSTVTDNGDGTYSVSLDGSADIPNPGTYTERWSGSYAGQDLRATGPVLVGADAGDAVTRRELRWDTARQLDDLWLGTVTATGATSVTVPELAAPLNEWEGHELYVYAGTGRGQTRRVTASGDWTGVLTVPAWTTQPTGAGIEGHRRFRVDEYNAALTRAVRQARGVWVEMEDRSLVQVSGQQEYAIPAGMVWLSAVETLSDSSTDTWLALQRAAGEWDAGAGTLRLLNGASAGVRMRLTGWRRPQRLDYDEQFADLDPAYLVDAACALLTASEIRSPALDRQAAAQTSAYWQTLAGAQLRRSALQDAIRVGA